MRRDTLDRIIELAPPTTVDVDECTYATKDLWLVRPPLLEGPKFSTLEALIGFLKADLDLGQGEKRYVHVASVTSVEILENQRDRLGQRRVYAQAECTPCGMPIAVWLDPETFVIMGQSRLAPGPSFQGEDPEPASERDRLLRLASTIKATEIRVSADDGISQEVTVRQGVVATPWKTIPNPFHLAPFRTFNEVEQPFSPFILRLRKADDGAELALFECDGGGWRLTAISAIAAYLRNQIPAEIPILS